MKRKTARYLMLLLTSLTAILIIMSSCDPKGLALALSGKDAIFSDVDYTIGELGGDLQLKKADDETKLTSYRLRWGSAEDEIIEGSDPITSATPTGEDLTIPVDTNTPIPDGATHIVIEAIASNNEPVSTTSCAFTDMGALVNVTVTGTSGKSEMTIEFLPCACFVGTSKTFTSELDSAKSFEVANVETMVIRASSPSTTGVLTSTKGEVIINTSEVKSYEVMIDCSESAFESKIVIPDEKNSHRLVMIDDFNDTTPLYYTLPDTIADVEIHPHGTPYVITRGTSDSELHSIDSDFSGKGTNSAIGTGKSFAAMAIDEKNEWIYIASLTKLYRYESINIGSLTTMKEFDDTDLIGSIRAIEVDIEGYVYLIGQKYDAGAEEVRYYVQKYDPTGNGSVMATSDYYLLDRPFDMIYKAPYLYVTNNTDEDTGDEDIEAYKILVYDTELELVDYTGYDFDEFPIPEDSPHDYHGLMSFVAINRKKFYLTDELYWSDPNYDDDGDDRLVCFDDLEGTGWDVYDDSGVSSGFDFWS